jgi:N-acetylmuramoyl-L-alanine amidase
MRGTGWRTVGVPLAAALVLAAVTTDTVWSRHMARHSHKHASVAKHHKMRLAALDPAAFAPAAAASKRQNLSAASCDPTTFRIVLDVGHTAESEGARSARNVAEFDFNLRLARQIAEDLKADGFADARLLVTQGKSKPSLFRRVAAANDLQADLFLSIHHDSVPNSLLEDWEFGGRKSHFSDRFGGYSVFVSRENPQFSTSLKFAELVGREMKAQGFGYAQQYTMPIMGRYQRQLLDKDTGVYRYDELVVLRKTRMPAVLLEAGSIINRDEELAMSSPERQAMIASGVATAVREFCDPRWAILGPL